AWYLTDRLGSVRDLANTSGTVIDHVSYDSFGNILGESNPSAGDRFKYTAREFDTPGGRYFSRSRYYESAIGRFASQDSIGFAGGDANLYRYVGNSPTNHTDPTGHDAFTVASTAGYLALSGGATMGTIAGVATGSVAIVAGASYVAYLYYQWEQASAAHARALAEGATLDGKLAEIKRRAYVGSVAVLAVMSSKAEALDACRQAARDIAWWKEYIEEMSKPPELDPEDEDYIDRILEEMEKATEEARDYLQQAKDRLEEALKRLHKFL
ncbi:MAG: RHS repeat-associated core domain-containing protein, partial [Isosphaeraceae bacterium]|nr:RHS repeat-associated core domain-containing protein [Isosphaeraceae bacterium]